MKKQTNASAKSKEIEQIAQANAFAPHLLLPRQHKE
jgi:Zn-dependent peptidase ImmA (M78 family)